MQRRDEGLSSPTGIFDDLCLIYLLNMPPMQYSMPSRHGGTLNSRQAASPLVRLVERERRWEVSHQPQDVLPRYWGGTEQNRTVNCMLNKAKANDRRKTLVLNY
ncbi:hypothetical protein TNCV_1725651 [Trichonephila clavipes]|nr:hypothetical protein TNCV_1725651 [Trichonephila clavipes]